MTACIAATAGFTFARRMKMPIAARTKKTSRSRKRRRAIASMAMAIDRGDAEDSGESRHGLGAGRTPRIAGTRSVQPRLHEQRERGGIGERHLARRRLSCPRSASTAARSPRTERSSATRAGPPRRPLRSAPAETRAASRRWRSRARTRSRRSGCAPPSPDARRRRPSRRSLPSSRIARTSSARPADRSGRAPPAESRPRCSARSAASATTNGPNPYAIAAMLLGRTPYRRRQ